MTTTPTTHTIHVTQEDIEHARARAVHERWCQSCPLARATLRQLSLNEVRLGSTARPTSVEITLKPVAMPNL